MNFKRNLILTFELLALAVIFQVIVSLFTLSIVFNANAEQYPAPESSTGWQVALGGAAFAVSQPWRNINNQLAVVPYVDAKYGRWSFGVNHLVAYQFYRSENFSTSLALTVRNTGYRSDTSIFRKKSKHRVFTDYHSPDVEVAGQFNLSWHWLNFTVDQDISDQSRSHLASLGLNIPVYDDQRGFKITATTAIDWLSKDYVNYYYGVDSKQTNITVGRHYYQTKSAINTRFAIKAVYPLQSKWLLVSQLEYTKLADEITASPLIGQDYSASMMLSAIYRF